MPFLPSAISRSALVILKVSASLREEYLLWLKLMMHFSIGILLFTATIEPEIYC